MRTILLTSVVTLFAGLSLRADDWPRWLGPKRDSVWREQGLIESFPKDGPPVLWRVEVGLGYTGPAVADGRVYVMDYSTTDKIGNIAQKAKLKGKERVLCYSVDKGELLWKHEYDCPYHHAYPGPRCTPTVDEGRVYTLGAESDLCCLDAKKGTVIWSKELKNEYKVKTPIWGFCGHPIIDGKRLIVICGGEGSVAVCFDKETGKELWKALSAKEPGYGAPTIIEHNKKRHLLIWHPESLNCLDPESGKERWSVPLVPKYGMSIMAPRLHGDYLFASGIGEVALLLKLTDDKPEEIWRAKKNDLGVFCANSTPFLEDGMIYGCCCMNGQLRGVELETGKRVWETFEPTTGGKKGVHGTAFLVKNGDRFFLMSETGELVIAKLSPKGYEEVSRCKLLEKTSDSFGRPVVWSHPAFANKCVFARNDKEMVCVSLEKK